LTGYFVGMHVIGWLLWYIWQGYLCPGNCKNVWLDGTFSTLSMRLCFIQLQKAHVLPHGS